MENASKALMIAGGILIALLVITLLVTFYSNLKDLMRVKENVELSEQTLEFNKEFDSYNRNNLYGSDILSLVNKTCDYNVRQANEQGYIEIEMEVIFKTSYSNYDKEEIVKKNKKYNATELKEIIQNIEAEIATYTSKVVTGTSTTIASISGYRTNELTEFLKQKGITNESRIDEIKKDISKYLSYKTMLSTIKSNTFNATKFEYDNTTGRITKMIFTQN